MSAFAKRCSGCRQTKPISDFTRNKASPDGFRIYCRACANDQKRARFAAQPDTVRAQARSQKQRSRAARPLQYLLYGAKRRAAVANTPFAITAADIDCPEYCPLLGVALTYGAAKVSDASASLDRINPSRGYVSGNVWVVSSRANRIKNDATLEELIAIVAALSNRAAA